MKRLNFCLVLLISLVIIGSCSSNKPQNNNNSTNLVVSNDLVNNTITKSNTISNFNPEEVLENNQPRDALFDVPSKQEQIKERKLKSIKEHYYSGNYTYIIKKKFNKNQINDFYYKGFAYYALARKTFNNPQLKKKYIEKSKQILKKVAKNSKNKELKAKAILWYGILKNVFPNKKLNNYEKISPFEYIKTRLSNTKSYDDALFYSGLIYERVGYLKSAKINYSKLDRIAKNNYIYHYAQRKVYPAKTISSYYLKNIDKKLNELRKKKATLKIKNNNNQKNQDPSSPSANQVDNIDNLKTNKVNQISTNYNPNGTIFQRNDQGIEEEGGFYEAQSTEKDPELVYNQKQKKETNPEKLLNLSLDALISNPINEFQKNKEQKNNQEIFYLDDN